MAAELRCLAASTTRLQREELKTKSAVAARLGRALEQLLREQQTRRRSEDRGRARRWVQTTRKQKSVEDHLEVPLAAIRKAHIGPLRLPYQIGR